MGTTLKTRLLELLLEKSFKYDDEPVFKLASGRMSNYYIDCRTTTHNPEGKHLIGSLIFEMIKDLEIQAVGGLTMGADPIACAVSHEAYLSGKRISSFSVRKEPKQHGTKRQIEGDVHTGDRVVIVEDVITTGSSTIKAIEAAQAAGLDVVKVIALVDREEGGRQEIARYVPDVAAICTRTELIEKYKSTKCPES
ncbi:MAG: orotate phosphoribosyltransferase [Desulfobacterota bacterium]|nr:orotate phosphoribosyltransferase [Thermodesulfobacteriota bacterium]